MTRKVFIHGWATDAVVWKDVAEALCHGEGEAVLPNLPGHASTTRWLEPSLNPALTEVSRVVEGEQCPVVGLGWSLGAEVLLGIAAREPDWFSALVLVGATPSFVRRGGFPHGQSPALVRRMIMDMKKDPSETLDRFYPLNFTGEERESKEARAFIKRYAPPGPLVCDEGKQCTQAFRYREITTALEALYNTDIRHLIENVEVPTLVVHGSDDEVVPPGAGEFLAEHLPRARLALLKSAGHAPFVTDKDRFVELVRDFLSKTPGPRAVE